MSERVDETAAKAGGGRAGKPRLRVLLVDDHRVMRAGLAKLLGEQPDMEIVGEADDGKQAVELVERLSPDVVVMDVSMPVVDGAEATRIIRREHPRVRVVALSMFEQEDLGDYMLDAGAQVYLCKSGPSESLLAAIRGGG